MKVLLSLIALSLGTTSSVAATNISGITFENRMAVDGGELVLNGAGLRTRTFFRVYAIGLCVSQRSTDANVLLVDRGAKRMRIVALRDVAWLVPSAYHARTYTCDTLNA